MSSEVPGDPVPSSKRRLNNWKDIAEHLGKDLRTAQRSEVERHLPLNGEGALSLRTRTSSISGRKAWSSARRLNLPQARLALLECVVCPVIVTRISPVRGGRF